MSSRDGSSHMVRGSAPRAGNHGNRHTPSGSSRSSMMASDALRLERDKRESKSPRLCHSHAGRRSDLTTTESGGRSSTKDPPSRCAKRALHRWSLLLQERSRGCAADNFARFARWCHGMSSKRKHPRSIDDSSYTPELPLRRSEFPQAVSAHRHGKRRKHLHHRDPPVADSVAREEKHHDSRESVDRRSRLREDFVSNAGPHLRPNLQGEHARPCSPPRRAR